MTDGGAVGGPVLGILCCTDIAGQVGPVTLPAAPLPLTATRRGGHNV